MADGKKGAFIPAPGPLREEFIKVYKTSIKQELPDESSSVDYSSETKVFLSKTDPDSEKYETEIKKELISNEEPPLVLKKGSIYIEDSIDIEESFVDGYDINNVRKTIKVEECPRKTSHKSAVVSVPKVSLVKQELLTIDDDECILIEEVQQPKVKAELVDLEEFDDSTEPNSPEDPNDVSPENTSSILEGVNNILAAEIKKIPTTPLTNQTPTTLRTEILTNNIKREKISPQSKRQKISHTSSDVVVKTEPLDSTKNTIEISQKLPVVTTSSTSEINTSLEYQQSPVGRNLVNKQLEIKLPLNSTVLSKAPQQSSVCEPTPTILPFLHLNYEINVEELRQCIGKLNWMNVKSIEKLDEVQKTEKYFRTHDETYSTQSVFNSKKIKLKNLTNDENVPSEVFYARSGVSNNLVQQFFCQEPSTHFKESESQTSQSKSETNLLEDKNKYNSCSTRHKEVPMDISSDQLSPKTTTRIEPPSINSSVGLFDDHSETLPKPTRFPPWNAKPSLYSFDASKDYPSEQQPSVISTHSSSEANEIINLLPSGTVKEDNQPSINQTNISQNFLSTDLLREVLRTASNITPENKILGKRPYVSTESDRPDPRRGPKKINISEYMVKKGISNIRTDNSSKQFLSGHVPLSAQSPLDSTAVNLPGINENLNSTEVGYPSSNREAPNSSPINSQSHIVTAQNIPIPDVRVGNNVPHQYHPMVSNSFPPLVQAYFMIQPHPSYPVLTQNLAPSLQYTVPQMTTQGQAYIPAVSSSHGLQPFHSTHDLNQPGPTEKTVVEAPKPSVQSSPTQLTVMKRFKNLAPPSLGSKLGVDYFHQQEITLLVLSWTMHQMTDCFRDNKLPPFGNKLVKVNKTYRSVKEHYNTYLPSLLLELFYRTFSLIIPKRPYTHCKFSSWKKGLISCNFPETENRGEIIENSLVSLRICEQDITTKILGYVACIKRGNHGTCKVYFTTAYERCSSSELKRVEALGLGSVQWFLDQHMALRKLPNSPLANQIINPRLNPPLESYTLSPMDSKLRKTAEGIKRNRNLAGISRKPSVVLISTFSEVCTVEKVVRLVTFLKEKVLLLVKTEQALVEVGLALLEQSCSMWTITSQALKKNLPKELTDRDLFDHGGPLPTIHCTLNDASCLLALSSYCFFEDLTPHLNKYTCILMEADCYTEPESLVPVLYGITDFILVGDPQVQCPVYSKKLAECNYGWSLFSRLQATCVK